MSWSLCGSKVQSPMKTAVSNYRCETILTLVQFSSNSSGRSSNGGDGCDDYTYVVLEWELTLNRSGRARKICVFVEKIVSLLN